MQETLPLNITEGRDKPQNLINLGEITVNLDDLDINFSLNHGQFKALQQMVDFVEGKSNVITLSGSAGTGKTSIVKILIEYLRQKYNFGKVILAAPTHKAKSILNLLTGTNEAVTLHSLLGLKPNLEVSNFDAKDLKFYEDLILQLFPGNTVYIIDEASMINDHLYKLIIDKLASYPDHKIIFIGDIRQLSPVKQVSKSKVFTNKDYEVIKLTKVERQADGNPLLKTLDKLQVDPLNKFEQEEIDENGLVTSETSLDFVKILKQGIQDINYRTQPFKAKVLSYTNKNVGDLNNIIRRAIYKRTDFLEVGDLLTALSNYTPIAKSNPILYNGSDYVVTALEKCTKETKTALGTLQGYLVTLYDTVDDCESNIFLLDPNLSAMRKRNIANIIEGVRQDAVDSKFSRARGAKFRTLKLWGEFRDMTSSFVSWCDLCIGTRVIVRAGLTYGYATTVHKSQGSTYDNVYIDMDDIVRYNNGEALRELQYVALSRARNKVVLKHKQ